MSSDSANVIDLSFGTTILIRNIYSDNSYQIFLPTLTNLRAQLGVSSPAPFCVPIRITIAKDSPHNIRLCPQSKAGNPVSVAEAGMLIDNDGNEWNRSIINMAPGDTVSFFLIYTLSTGYYAQLATWMN